MTTIIFNETNEYEIESYTRTTTFSNNMSNSSTLIGFGDVNVNNRGIYSLGDTTITSIQLKINNTIIDTLENLNTNIVSINENLNGNHLFLEVALFEEKPV